MIFSKKQYRLLTSLWLLTAPLFFATLTGCNDKIAPPDGDDSAAQRSSYSFLYSVESGTQWSYHSSLANGTLQAEFGAKLSMAPSGSGKSLMIGDNDSLYLIDLATGNVLASFGISIPNGRFLYYSPAISPDGTRLAWAEADIPSSSSRFVLVDVTGENRVELNDLNFASSSFIRFSPDGNSLAFFSYDKDAQEGWLYRVNTDGTGLQQLTEASKPLVDGAATFDWSPDGSKIVFSQEEQNGNASLHIINADGTAHSELAMGAFAPDWSPDGTKILYTTPWPFLQMGVINPDGTGAEILTPSTHGVLGRWSPDGKHILYAEYNKGIDPEQNPARIRIMDVASRSTTTVSSEGGMFGLYWVE